MKIGIDISQLAFPGTGVAIYTQNLVENLLKIDKENEYFFFFSSLRRPVPEDLKSKIKNLKSYKFPPTILELLWNKLHVLSAEKFTGKLDVFHTSDWLEPPVSCSKVTTIHDLALYKYPQTFPKKIILNQKRKLKWVKKESKLIIAVSQSTKDDIVEILGISDKKIKVVHEACDSSFSKQPEAKIEKTKKKYGIEGKYLLAVGTREPRKNLRRVMDAYRILGINNLELVVVGKFGWGDDIKDVNSKMPNVKFVGYVPKEDLPALYSGSECFVYPSLYEGFGLPILEAMNCGTPVITSNISSMPEVSGKAAVLVNPEEAEDIAEGIKEALEKRKDLIKKGKERAKEFSWEKTAKETLKIYQEAVK